MGFVSSEVTYYEGSIKVASAGVYLMVSLTCGLFLPSCARVYVALS